MVGREEYGFIPEQHSKKGDNDSWEIVSENFKLDLKIL